MHKGSRSNRNNKFKTGFSAIYQRLIGFFSNFLSFFILIEPYVHPGRKTRSCILVFELEEHYQLIIIEEDASSDEDIYDAEEDPFTELLLLQDEWFRLQGNDSPGQRNGESD